MLLAVELMLMISPARTGTLLGMQFEWNATHMGNQLEIYTLPTVNPVLPKERVDPHPIEYSLSPIAIGSTGLRRYRRVSASLFGQSGPNIGEEPVAE